MSALQSNQLNDQKKIDESSKLIQSENPDLETPKIAIDQGTTQLEIEQRTNELNALAQSLAEREANLKKHEAEFNQRSTSYLCPYYQQVANKSMILIRLTQGHQSARSITQLIDNKNRPDGAEPGPDVAPDQITYKSMKVFINIENLNKKILIQCDGTRSITDLLWSDGNCGLSTVLKSDWDAGKIPHLLDDKIKLFVLSNAFNAGGWVQIHGVYFNTACCGLLFHGATIKNLCQYEVPDADDESSLYDNDMCVCGTANSSQCPNGCINLTHTPDLYETSNAEFSIKWVINE